MVPRWGLVGAFCWRWRLVSDRGTLMVRSGWGWWLITDGVTATAGVTVVFDSCWCAGVVLRSSSSLVIFSAEMGSNALRSSWVSMLCAGCIASWWCGVSSSIGVTSFLVVMLLVAEDAVVGVSPPAPFVGDVVLDVVGYKGWKYKLWKKKLKTLNGIYLASNIFIQNSESSFLRVFCRRRRYGVFFYSINWEIRRKERKETHKWHFVNNEKN